MTVDHRANLLRIFEAALAAVHGRKVVRESLQQAFPPGPVHLVAIGKAAVAMAQGARDALGDAVVAGLVVTKHGHGEPLPWPVIEAGHPLPDADSLVAGDALLDYLDRLPADATVLVLLSGGASSLVEVPVPGVTLEQLVSLNRRLLAAGMSIDACNRVRKAVSTIKGGRLAARIAPRPVLCLAISDVPGDDPAVIGSGLLAPDTLHPPAVPAEFSHWLDIAAPAPGDPAFAQVEYRIVARSADAQAAAADAAQELGYSALRHTELLRGDAVQAGRSLAAQLCAAATGTVQVWGGETTVILPSRPGRGGRNQSLALATAIDLAGRDGCLLLAAGSDGSDGPTDDAGALVDGSTVQRGSGQGLDVDHCLATADAGSFLTASGDLVTTGPTGTNVMDLVLGLRWR
jgi:hydroxypyruvate reductase